MKKCFRTLGVSAFGLAGLVFLCGSISQLAARPVPARVFGSHMVLQSGVAAPVWGTADAGEKITVTFGGQAKTAAADASGRWLVRLDPLAPSSEPRELAVSGGGESVVRFADVLVGEVWLCSGQSNMAKPLGEQRNQKPVFNAEEEIRTADFPQIRLFKVKRVTADAPAAEITVDSPWVACRPDTVDAIKFSAAGYFFGRKLHRELGVPIGLIDASWGGRCIELFIPAEGFDTEPSLSVFAVAARQPGAKVGKLQPSSIHNGMIHALAPFAIRGAIWYQGESNLIDDDGEKYAEKMGALVRGWRNLWQGEFSFYYVQLAPHLYHVHRSAQVASPEALPRFWNAQTAAMKLPRTGMIVTTDLTDDLFDIHPRNKLDVGERLARWALAKDYARNDVVFSGPVFRGMEIEGNTATLTFDHAHGGLVSKDRKALRWFTIAGADGVFWPGVAKINKDGRVEVSSPKVSAPKVVRFAWDEAAQPNLFNGAGLPAVPFRTDAAVEK